MEMGGILGAKVILKCKNMRYRNIFIIATTLVLSGVLVEYSGKLKCTREAGEFFR